MRFLGVDPGVFGAIACLDSEGRVMEIAATPTIRDEKGRRAYNLDALRPLILRLIDGRPGDVFAAIEKLRAMPFSFRGKGDSVTGEETRIANPAANFNCGLGMGVWTCAFAVLGVPRETRLLVRPQEWQRVQLAGAAEEGTKAKSIAQAKRLWPGVSLVMPRGRTDSDGAADALHVAQYGRMVHLGGPVFAALNAERPTRRNDDVFRRA